MESIGNNYKKNTVMKGFTKCENGHYYKEELVTCPYCGIVGNKETGIAGHAKETQLYTKVRDEDKTRLVAPQKLGAAGDRTVFGEEVIAELEGRQVVQKEYRKERRLVGWLVTYSIDKMGMDFRLYEGRNVIGRDVECNITVPDQLMSGKHATILFKNDKFKITDELSSHGTFVNEKDIEDEHIELHDNDLIRMGETLFKFKVAL
jgi:hypothetical protein